MFSPSRANLTSFSLIVLSLGLAQPVALLAQAPGCSCPAPCAPISCCAPPVTCCAPPPPPDVCTCTTYKPVCDTCYHQQPVVTYHDVCRTCYRQEPYCVTVPVTKVDCVTCDEGCYKMVWCPRMVTKQVPRVEYHQQQCCRTVPYTVTQRVPQVMTQIVPEYRVRYCPQTHTFIKPNCCPQAPSCGVPSCGVPGCGVPGCGVPGCGVPGPYVSQVAPAGMPAQALAAAPMLQQQLPSVQQASSGAPAASNGADADAYARARAAANVWQTNRNLAAQ
jgi:hypothetical protein